MTTERMRFAIDTAEPYVADAMRQHGYIVEPYGQGMLTPAAREILKDEPVRDRWTPDFLVQRPAIVDRPRWPAELRDKYSFYTDVKYRNQGQWNYSIEMRSLLAAPTFGFDLYYVCGTREHAAMVDIGIVRHDQVIQGWGVRPCCAGCWEIYTRSPDPMRDLPTYCPGQRKGRAASGTPYVIFPAARLEPLTDFAFDNLRHSYYAAPVAPKMNCSSMTTDAAKTHDGDFCPGCGYYWYTHNGTHRDDCTLTQQDDS